MHCLHGHNCVYLLQFLMKMLHIRERRRSLVPTIIEGETGVGKTKLLTVYAAIESMSVPNNFNALEVLRLALESVLASATMEHLKQFIKDKFVMELRNHELSMQSVLRACVQAVLEVRLHEPTMMLKVLNAIRAVMEGPLYLHPLFNPAQLLFFMKTMLEDPKTEGRAEFGVDVASTVMTTEKYRQFNELPLEQAVASLRDMWAFTSDSKNGLATGLYEQSEEDMTTAIASYSRMIFNQLQEESKPKPKKADDDDAEPVFVLPGIHAFARWVLAWMLVQPVPMFHTILMHAAYTVDDLRRELAPVIRFAGRVEQLYCPAGVERAQKIVVDGGVPEGMQAFV